MKMQMAQSMLIKDQSALLYTSLLVSLSTVRNMRPGTGILDGHAIRCPASSNSLNGPSRNGSTERRADSLSSG